MLNKNNERELAYVVTIDNITPIEGYDRVELAHIMGWTVVVGKDEFNIGDPAIYFEIDSQLPEVEPFVNMEFLAKKHFKIKTQRMCKSLSQGLLMSAANFGWTIEYDTQDNSGDVPYIVDNNNEAHYVGGETRFLTKLLNVTYAETADNKRKAPTIDKYKAMSQRHPKLFSKKPIRWLMKREWGRKFMFFFFGKKRDNKNSWPYWVKKTDEERIENMPWIFDSNETWIATEKIDGTSTTFTMKRRHWPFKNEFYICSRNVVLNDPNKPCFYDSNVYAEMAEKYNIKEVLEQMLKRHPEEDWITIQGETYGKGIQKNEYGLEERKFAAFNLVTSKKGRLPTPLMHSILFTYNIECVPILETNYKLPATIEELRNYVNSIHSLVTEKGTTEMREGIVFRDQEGVKSFKCVSPEYLLKFHQ